MSLVSDLFSKSPFGPLVEHTKKVHACVEVVRPLLDAVIAEDYEEVHRLQDKVSALEYEADKIKHAVRDQLQRRYFFGMEKGELESFLRCQDKIADAAEDFAIILLIRNTKIHPSLREDFVEFADQVLDVSNTLLSAATELDTLVETSFGGAEAQSVLDRIVGLGEAEWKADRLQRRLSRKMYELEAELEPITLMFYDKILNMLGSIANHAENTGDLLRMMIVKK